jgi:YVTN family beta-propeller protein
VPSGLDFGSIIQSIAIDGERLYVLGNTADRIDILDAATRERRAQITGVVSPRYIAFGPSDKAYVTSFYGAPNSYTGGMVTVIDIKENTKVKEIQVGANPEGVAVAGDRVFVANHSSEAAFGGGNTISVIDTGTDEVVQTITLDCTAPRMVIADEQDDVWVFCAGQILYDDQFNVIGTSNGGVRVLNGETGAVITSFDHDGRIETFGPGQDVFYDDENEDVYVVQDSRSVYRYDTRANRLAGPAGTFEGDPIGAIAVDGESGRFYVGHGQGFTDQGYVTVHEASGTDIGPEIGRFEAGISPTYITFVRSE